MKATIKRTATTACGILAVAGAFAAVCVMDGSAHEMAIRCAGAVAFGAMAVLAAYGIVKGAWWHIGTLAICLTVVKASIADIKKEEGKA